MTWEARVLDHDPNLFTRNRVRLLVLRQNDAGTENLLENGETYVFTRDVALPEGQPPAGFSVPVDALDAIGLAIEAFRGRPRDVVLLEQRIGHLETLLAAAEAERDDNANECTRYRMAIRALVDTPSDTFLARR